VKDKKGLVEHAIKAWEEKWGYVYGTFGQLLTLILYSQQLGQYPKNIKQFAQFIKDNWLNRRVTDCVGLIKSFLWWSGENPTYNRDTDLSANGMYEMAKSKGKTGTIKTIPEIPGLGVWLNGHIGVYIGNGDVIESRGTKYGVVKTKLKDRPWTHWLECPFISYEDVIVVEPISKPIEPHWGEEPYSVMRNLNLIVNEKRFEDPLKRGESFALFAQQQTMIAELSNRIKKLEGVISHE
jgi:hypothetical protein